MKIRLEESQRLFFTSDTHYNHKNICRGVSDWGKGGEFSTRDFNTLSKMNDTIVNGINEVVGQDDILIHLGDWSFGGIDSISEFRRRIICKNIHLVLGNHDHHILNNKVITDDMFDEYSIQTLFSSVSPYTLFEIQKPNNYFLKNTPKLKGYGGSKQFITHKFACCHYPLASWDSMKKGVIHLHGHLHLPKHKRLHQGKSMDVGMDGNGLEPVIMEEVLNIMRNQPIANTALKQDHHI